MLKQIVRAFSLGLITAGIIFMIIYFIDEDSSNQASSPVTVEEAIELVESNGYYVYDEEMAVSVEDQEDEETTNINSPDQEEGIDAETEDADNEEADGHMITIMIESGMGISDIIALLEENNVLDDPQAFTTYLTENDLSRFIQAGEFTVETDVSPEELANTLTRQNTE
ncbi:endolytic transglycosylase MltG [Gracilibacillus alcaliphilus]|uniref:endolytic transglycosylase MltG n=1 Tax=Gracilibacillus alcaliphilus TaxID=1401441 RepID=UPI00195CE4E1|nr:endolytic transglycosylase MltG [Gracilibacillus alcaliphilus]MBM7675020.1 hypothetical protein [Gracilibacillus alcaliphilus]